MTVATVRSTVVTELESITSHGGVANVFDEQVADSSKESRVHRGRVHFWTVSVSTPSYGGGAGYEEPLRRVRIEGFIGVATDDPAGGTSSYELAANLQDAVVAALWGADFTLDLESVTGDSPIPRRTVNVFDEQVECHVVGVTALILECT